MTLLSAAGVTVVAGEKRLLSDVSLQASSGEFVALLGPNGAGKTTLLRALLGLRKPRSGHVLIDGKRADKLPARARAAEVAWLPQELVPSEPLLAIELVMAARYRFDETRKQAREQAERALARLHAAELAQARIDHMSGGERQRVALAGLLAQEARILLLDEPGNHLDPAHQAETYRLLGQLWSEGLGVICVTHDVNLLAHAGRPELLRVIGLSQGKVAFSTRYADPELGALLSRLFGVSMATFGDERRRFIVPIAEVPS